MIKHLMDKANGGIFMPNYHFRWYEADLIYITQRNYSTEFEIKISRADFRNDFNKTCGMIPKWQYLMEGKGTNYFYYVVPKGIIKVEEVPPYAGLVEINLDGRRKVDYLKTAPRLHKNNSDYIRNRIYEKAYFRYENKILLPAIRKIK
jgi:hypothetical protein